MSIYEPLRDVVGRALFEEPPLERDWYSLTEDRREPWRRDADRVITAIADHCTPRMERAALDMGAIDWLAAGPADVLAEMMAAEMTDAPIDTDTLDELVARFSAALLRKLRAAEAKYSWQNGWQKDDWGDVLRKAIREHVEKGDPRDVAAYCAFAWHHKWSLANCWCDPNSEEPNIECPLHGNSTA